MMQSMDKFDREEAIKQHSKDIIKKRTYDELEE